MQRTWWQIVATPYTVFRLLVVLPRTGQNSRAHGTLVRRRRHRPDVDQCSLPSGMWMGGWNRFLKRHPSNMPNPSGSLGYHTIYTIAPMPMRNMNPLRIIITNKTKHSKTRPYQYFMAYTVHTHDISVEIHVADFSKAPMAVTTHATAR